MGVYLPLSLITNHCWKFSISKASLVDPVLGKVPQFVMSGWPAGFPNETITPCHNRRNELSCEQDCVLWGFRVIIPPVFRAKMLGKLHWKHSLVHVV